MAAPAYPARVDLPWDDVDGRVFVALPRRRTRFERWVSRFVPTPENTLLTFEGEAAAFWRLADGTRPVGELASALPGAPPVARVDAYARRLAARGLVRLHAQATPVVETQRGLGVERGFHHPPCRRCGLRVPVRARVGALYLCPRCKRPNRVRAA